MARNDLPLRTTFYGFCLKSTVLVQDIDKNALGL